MVSYADTGGLESCSNNVYQFVHTTFAFLLPFPVSPGPETVVCRSAPESYHSGSLFLDSGMFCCSRANRVLLRFFFTVTLSNNEALCCDSNSPRGAFLFYKKQLEREHEKNDFIS